MKAGEGQNDNNAGIHAVFQVLGVILLNQCSILHEMGGKEEKYKDRIVLTEQVADLCTELADLYDL